VAYWQQRNHAAHGSHRKRRIALYSQRERRFVVVLGPLSQIKSPSLTVRNARSEVFTCADKTCYNPPQHRRALGAVPLAVSQSPIMKQDTGRRPTATFQEG
jgi:hypothetical protein